MASRKEKKKLFKEVADLASSIPVMFRDCVVYSEVFGIELMRAGQHFASEKYFDHESKMFKERDVPVEPSKKYTVKVADRVKVDHTKSIKKILMSKGVAAVKKYVDDCIELYTESVVPKQIGGITTIPR